MIKMQADESIPLINLDFKNSPAYTYAKKNVKISA